MYNINLYVQFNNSNNFQTKVLGQIGYGGAVIQITQMRFKPNDATRSL